MTDPNKTPLPTHDRTETQTLTQLADELEAAITSGDKQEQRRIAAALHYMMRSQSQLILYHGNFCYKATVLWKWNRLVIHRTPYPEVLEYIPTQEILT